MPAFAFPGTPAIIDGATAVTEIVRRSSELVAIGPEWGSASRFDRGHGVIKVVRRSRDGRALAGSAAGAAATGLRGTVLSGGSTLSEMRQSLAVSAGHRLPYVIHHLCAPAGLAGSHDPHIAVADTGTFQLFALNVQEASDFALIARHAAESALTPGIVFEDLTLTGTALQTIRSPEAGLIEEFLGKADDRVESGTPAQEMLFGASRRRVPRLLDIDRPFGAGMRHDADSAADNLAARDIFFHRDLARILDRSMDAFGELTGRRYARASGYRLDDADFVVVAQGAVVENLEAVAHYLRKHERIRAGVLNLTTLRPFPGAAVSKLLEGRRIVTVLEQDGQALAEDPPLLGEVRAALDRASENGRVRNGHLPNPEYAAYRRPADRPQLIGAINAGGVERSTFADLRALFLNMVAGPEARQRFYIGSRLGRASSRLPAAERIQQQVRAAFPDIERDVLHPDHSQFPEHDGCGTFQIRTGTGWSGSAIGDRIARAIFDSRGGRIRTARGGGEHTSDGAAYTVAHSPTGLPPEIFRGRVDALVASTPALLGAGAGLGNLGEDGLLLVQTPLAPEKLWAGLPQAVRRVIRQKRLRLYLTDARAVATDLVDDPVMIRLLAEQALAGAFVEVYFRPSGERPPSARKGGRREEPSLPATAGAETRDRYLKYLGAEYTARPDLHDYFEQSLAKGADAVHEVVWKDFQFEEVPEPERAAPWVLGSSGDGSSSDLAAAWESSGYLRMTGRADEAPIDPAFSIGVMPARSSAFRTTEGFADHLPQLLPENCTACGTCWTWCPDSAIPTTVQDIGSLLGTAVDACTRDGIAFVQLQRLTQHLVKQAHKLLADDELSRYITLDLLLQDAVDRLIERMQMRDDQREALLAEFAHVRARVDSFPIVKSDAFFRDREKGEKGSGLAFALAIDPDACKSCGLCAAVCFDGAIEMVDASPQRAVAARHARDFLLQLPDTPVEQLQEIGPDGIDDAALALINRRVYYTLVGGDNSPPGNGARTELHLALAAVEARQQAGTQALRERIAELAAGVDRLLQTKVNGVLHVSDYEKLGQRLGALEADRLGLQDLISLMEEDEPGRSLDAESVLHLTRVLGALRSLSEKYASGRARSALVIGADGEVRWLNEYPANPFSSPWLSHLDDDAPAVAEGAYHGVMAEMSDTFRTLREARLLIDDTFLPAEHGPLLNNFGPDDFSQEEWQACPPMLVVTNKYTEQINELLRSGLSAKVVVLNAERPERVLSNFADGEAYVLQSTPAFAEHLWNGIAAGLSFRGPALFHLHAPDPAADGTAPEETAELARLAVESRAFPVFTYDPRSGTELQERLSLAGNPAIESDWATGKVTVEMPNGLKRLEHRPVLFADWAARQGRYFAEFTFVPKRDWTERMIPLHEFLAMAEPGDRQPYVEVPGAAGKPVRKLVSPRMVAATDAALARWRLLLEMAGLRSTLADRLRREIQVEMEQELADATAEIAAEHEAKLAEQERTHAERYHAALTRQLLALSGFGEGTDDAKKALRAFMEETTGEEEHAGIS